MLDAGRVCVPNPRNGAWASALEATFDGGDGNLPMASLRSHRGMRGRRARPATPAPAAAAAARVARAGASGGVPDGSSVTLTGNLTQPGFRPGPTPTPSETTAAVP